ncbi:MAG TPA: NAD(P)H-binding protein [Pelobium sp.]|nr:NAD(P)H-binding protein [Pelobium sp.]
MKIAIIGATGFVGKALTTEALNRGHEVTAIARNVEGLTVDSEKLHKVKADIFNIEATAELLKNQDLVISSYNPGWTNLNIYDDFLAGSKAIQEAVKKAEKRLIVIGGGGSLYVAPGLQVVDTVGFPEEYKAGAKAARDYLTFIQQEKELDWTFFSPALEMHPGITTGRTGKFRLGKNNPVFNDKKESKLSVEDLAVVILDEAENPQHRRERFTAAY